MSVKKDMRDRSLLHDESWLLLQVQPCDILHLAQCTLSSVKCHGLLEEETEWALERSGTSQHDGEKVSEPHKREAEFRKAGDNLVSITGQG